MDRIHAGSFQYGKQTQTAATLIEQVIAGRSGAIARVTSCVYDMLTAANTVSHVLAFMKALAHGTLQTTPAVSATSIVVDTASLAAAYMGGDILATSDRIVYQYTDGTWEANTVTAINTTTGALTVTALSATRVLVAGQRIYYMGIPGDGAHLLLNCKGTVVTNLNDPIAGVAQGGFQRVVSEVNYKRTGYGDPMLFSSNNATTAGMLASLSGYYAKQ